MSSDVLLGHGDLLEYHRETKGEPNLPDEITVRAIVRGFEVTERDYTGEINISVWLYEGAIQLGEPEERDGMTVTEGVIDRERELVAFDLDYLLSLDPTVVRRGNSPRELTLFEVGSDESEDTE